MGTYERARMQTKMKICKAFWGLYQENSIDKITVKDITDVCGIHRATFYLHFTDVYDVLEQIQNMLLDEVRQICETEEKSESAFDREGLTHRLYFHYLKRWEYLHYMLGMQRLPEFYAAYRQILVDEICRISGITLEELPEKERKVVQVALYSMAEVFMICADEDSFTFDDTVNLLSGFSHRGINDILNRKYGIQLCLDMTKE